MFVTKTLKYISKIQFKHLIDLVSICISDRSFAVPTANWRLCYKICNYLLFIHQLCANNNIYKLVSVSNSIFFNTSIDIVFYCFPKVVLAKSIHKVFVSCQVCLAAKRYAALSSLLNPIITPVLSCSIKCFDPRLDEGAAEVVVGSQVEPCIEYQG